ncbi:unnamed protein product [Linum trigynum]|uniref:Uncharacterized protein n=1 Tax=Linum trigynum TaxID=586398 RepID=A0AAV2GF52_9ROSI
MYRGDGRHGWGYTEDYWPIYALPVGIGTLLGWAWLLMLGSFANQMTNIAVHILTTYLAVISVLCFWSEQFFWGVTFAIGAGLQFLYVISVIDRKGVNHGTRVCLITCCNVDGDGLGWSCNGGG